LDITIIPQLLSRSAEKLSMIDQAVDEALGAKSLSAVSSAITHHISDEDLERHLLGAMKKGVELEMIEEHLLWCEICIWRRRKSEDYINSMRAALTESLSS
jgi:hypothetical protein